MTQIFPPTPVFELADYRQNMIGSIKNWEKTLYNDVAVNGMSYEAAKRKHNYNSYMKWGQKRFDKVYDSFYEIYLATHGKDAMGEEIAKSAQIVYILIALVIGLCIAFVFIKLTKN